MTSAVLSPEEQWRKSVALVGDWLSSVRPAIEQLARAYDINCPKYDDYRRERDALYSWVVQEYFSGSKRYNLPGYCEHLAACNGEDWTLGVTWFPGVVAWNDRHLLEGDLVFAQFWNGRERHPIWCVSSKGHRLCGLYYDTNRLGARGTIIRLLDVPDQFVGSQLTDPDAELYFLSLRAGTSASG
jgi:hypothetical protein